MPRTAKPKGDGKAVAKDSTTDYGVTFVNVHLSDADKEALSQWDVSNEDLVAWLERTVDNGYKVSFSQDINNACHIVAITGKDTCSPPDNKGLCLMSRGSSLRHALYSAIFKTENYCIDGVFPLTANPAAVDFG
jgi:hypothetical protein